MKNEVLQLEELTWKQLDRLDREKALVFITLSPIEEHGPHLPLGMDFFNGQRTAGAVARKFKKLKPEWSVVLCPPIPLGTQCIELTGTISIRRDVLRDVAVDFAGAIAKYGFKYFIILTGHMAPVHGAALEEAAGIVAKRYNVKAISPILQMVRKIRYPEPGKPLLKGMPKNTEEVEYTRKDVHAGWRETSLLLLQRPGLVDKCYKDLPPALLTRPGDLSHKAIMAASGGLGYVGIPADASLARGRALFEGLTQLALEAVLEMVEGTNSNLQMPNIKQIKNPKHEAVSFQRSAFGKAGIAD